MSLSLPFLDACSPPSLSFCCLFVFFVDDFVGVDDISFPLPDNVDFIVVVVVVVVVAVVVVGVGGGVDDGWSPLNSHIRPLKPVSHWH